MPPVNLTATGPARFDTRRDARFAGLPGVVGRLAQPCSATAPASSPAALSPIAASDSGTGRRPVLQVSAHQSGSLITIERSRLWPAGLWPAKSGAA